jgi:hypothetical protein
MTDYLDKIDEETLTQVLGELMSAISEDCYAAGWMNGTEYLVPALCQRVLKINRPQPWAHGELGPGMAALLQTIADKPGHWANLDKQGVGYVSFNPFPTPSEYVKELDDWNKRRD